MAKYNYDRKALKGLTPGAFLGEVKERVKHIEASQATIPNSIFNPNKVAKALHPGSQYVKVSKVTDHGDAKSFILVPDEAHGTKSLAYFRAGQYISVSLDINGITPFYSMAAAIADGIEDFNLIILYGSRNKDCILLKDELDEIEKRATGKVKVVHVLSDEEAEGYEHGFLTAELIKKYAVSDYSIFVCGPKAMYKFLEGEVAKLGLPERRVRFEVSGEYGDPANDPEYPKDAIGKEFTITVNIRGTVKKVPCKAETSLLRAMEAAGIRVPSDCRSGECGWCHSRLISGKVFVPKSVDGRRIADKKFDWIHPCNTYALSDVEVEVFPLM